MELLNEDVASIQRAVAGVVVPQKRNEGTPVALHDVQRDADEKRFAMFEKLCDDRKLLPHQLAACDIGTVAGWLVEQTGLPIEKFEPSKLRTRIAEYVMAKG